MGGIVVKKLICTLLMLTMLLTALASAQAADITGKWYSSDIHNDNTTVVGSAYGMEVTVDFHSNGKCDLTFTQQGKYSKSSAEWDLDGSYGTIGDVAEFTVSGSRINLFLNGLEAILTRSQPTYISQTSIARALFQVSDKVYTGQAVKPAVTVWLNDTPLTQGTDYTVSYKNNTSVGRATAVITGKGRFNGQAKAYFDITPKASQIKTITAGNKAAIVKWNTQPRQASGYIIAYDTSSSFKNARIDVVTKPNIGFSPLRRLKSGKKYYVRIMTYKNINGIRYYSKWSSVKTVKVN